MITSSKTNTTTNVIPFPKGLGNLPLDIPPEEAAEIMNDELASSPELIADLKRRAKTLLVGPVKSLAIIREKMLATTDPVKAAECAKDWAVALLKDVNDRKFRFTPEMFVEMKRIADFFRAINNTSPKTVLP
jgi:hypothetical protein